MSAKIHRPTVKIPKRYSSVYELSTVNKYAYMYSSQFTVLVYSTPASFRACNILFRTSLYSASVVKMNRIIERPKKYTLQSISPPPLLQVNSDGKSLIQNLTKVLQSEFFSMWNQKVKQLAFLWVFNTVLLLPHINLSQLVICIITLFIVYVSMGPCRPF